MSAEGQPENSPEPPPGTTNEQIQHAPVSARVPPHVARGVMSNLAIVFEGPNEFVVDFVLRMAAPYTVAARIVMSHTVLSQFMNALGENVKMYEDRFGKPAPLPAPPADAPKTTVADLYDQVKLPDEMMSGVYANAVMIGHTPSEFWFDFITNFYPRSAVASRVYLSAQQVPGLLQTLTTSYQAHQRKQSGGQQPPPHHPPPHQPPPTNN
jgi:hypothetical protein